MATGLVPTDRSASSPTGSSGPEVRDRRIGEPTIAFAVGTVLSLIGFVIGARALTDNSFLTHLATGRIILATGAVPTVDPYSLDGVGQSWTVQSWLPSLIYAGLEALVGPWSIRVFNGALTATLTAGLWRLTAPARQLVTRAAVTVLPVAVGTVFWAPRPLLVALVAFVGCLIVWREHRSPWFFVPLLWVWVNSHGSFPLLVLFLLGAATGRIVDDRRLPRHELRYLIATTVGLGVAAVNPLGLRLLLFPFATLARREVMTDVIEWSPPTFSHWVEWSYLVNLLVVMVAARRRAQWCDLLPALGFVTLGLLAVRNFSTAGPVVAACASPALCHLFGTVDGRQRGRSARLVVAVAALGAVAVGVAVAAGSAFNLHRYPADEVDALERSGLVADRDVHLLHRDWVGNYLTYRFGPDAAVWVDDRFDFHHPERIDDHRDLVNGVGVGPIIGRLEPDVVLWESGTEVARWLEGQDDWLVRSPSDAWVLACRRSSPVLDRCP